MKITVTAIELNARRENVAICNGLNVTLMDAPALTGSEKQVAWAEKIREKAIADLAREVAETLKLMGPSGRLATVDAFDAAMAQINAGMEKLAERIASATSAVRWIEARSSSGKYTILEATK